MSHSLIPAFQLHMNQPINKGLTTIGKYDGKHPMLTAATNAGKVFIHNPHEKDHKNQIRFLNINRDVNCLTSGRLNPKSKKDVLLIGTQTNLLAYDVEENADIFYREVPDGLNTITLGKIGSLEMPLAIVGGNCSLQGYDHQGNEQYWTTTGGNVTAMAVIDIDKDGQSELLVGSDDYTIYIYKDDEIFSEVAENDQVTSLCRLRDAKYGYSLQNGTVGVYDTRDRLWRSKSKSVVTAMESYDLDGDGVPELILGFDNGKVEVRTENTGSVIYRDTMSGSVSSILKADYRMDGKEEVICCSFSGEIRGYLPVDNEVQQSFDTNLQEEELMKLSQRKEELLTELANYEENVRKMKSGEVDSSLINTDTKVNCHLEPNQGERRVDVVFETAEEQVIKCAIITAEQLFETESKFLYSKEPTNKIQVGLTPKKDIPIDLNIQVLVGHNMGTSYHVFELNYQMPRFSLYVPVQEFSEPPQSFVSFHVHERVNRIIMWFNQSFNIKYSAPPNQKTIDFKFMSLRNFTPLHFSFRDQQMNIYVDSMDTAGDIIQDFTQFLGVNQLESTCNFPVEFSRFEQVLNQVEEYNASRLKLTAEMADSSQIVKALVIKAEDSRLLSNMKGMREAYNELYRLNKDLMNEYTKRSNNHNELLSSLKEVNQMIQKAARLRLGDSKARVIAECRQAVKSNNIHSLFKIIQSGRADK